MKKKTKFVYSLIAGIVAASIGAVIAIYSLIVNTIVENKTIDTITELATHDKNSINMFVTYNWRNLARIGSRLNRTAASLHAMADVNEYLDTEAEETPFDEVYLLAEDGSYYTGYNYIQAPSTQFYDFKSLFKNDVSETIAYDELPSIRGGKVVIYGFKLENALENPVICGKKMYAVIGINSRASIRDGLIIGSFTDDNGINRGYSSIIDGDGDYIVNINDSGNVVSENWIDHLDINDKSGISKEEALSKMKNGETFWFYHQKEIERELHYCIPMENGSDWYFLLSVNDEALAEQSYAFVLLIVIALSITVLITIVTMVIVLYTQSKTAKALAQEKAQSEFLSNMSHEIRTPLNGLVGLNYLVMTSIDDPEKKDQIKEWLAKSHSTANYLLSLINDVLDVSKLKAGKVEMLREPLLIETVMDAIYSMQHGVIASRNISYLTESDISAPCILGDEVHIKQVLMNIVGNAAKFTPAGGYIKLSVSQKQTDETHVLTTFVCEDTGCGMSKEFTTRIFDAFSQDRNSNTSSIKGTGLGMAISKLLIDAMGGEIVVESELGKGSKFTVTVPSEISDIPEYMKQHKDAVQSEDKRAQTQPPKENPLNILIAEDNELNAEILLEILGDAGFTAEHAKDGSEAVTLFEQSQENEFDLILMDMQMPVMDGCTASEKIRQLPRADAKTIPIFACTANTFKEDRIKAFNSGMNDFLTKPIDVKVLLQKMETLNNEKNKNGKEK